MAVTLLICGVVGSIIFSLYIKKTGNYRLCIRAIPLLALGFMAIMGIFLNTIPYLWLVFINTACIGFSFTPLVPICFDLGCEMAFPIGEATVIGILNGGSMIYTFIFTSILNATVGLNSKSDSFILMVVFSIILMVGGILFWFVKVVLKRKMVESGEMHVDDIYGHRQASIKVELTMQGPE